MDTNNTGSGMPGSPTNVPSINANPATPGGQTGLTGGGTDKAKAYDELATRFGAQGQELGEYRQFFQNIAPLLDKLDQSPELVQAIIDGKVDKDLAKAVAEGRVDVRDAAAVQQAHEQVKKDLGKEGYANAKPGEIEKLIDSKVSLVRRELEEKAELQHFEDYTKKFIESTSDFSEYADAIDKWLDEHDVTDIEIAYYAVKGQMSEASAKKAAEAAAADRAKDVMANASGGGVTSQYSADGVPLVDKLIAGRPNPNSFFPGA